MVKGSMLKQMMCGCSYQILCSNTTFCLDIYVVSCSIGFSSESTNKKEVDEGFCSYGVSKFFKKQTLNSQTDLNFFCKSII